MVPFLFPPVFRLPLDPGTVKKGKVRDTGGRLVLQMWLGGDGDRLWCGTATSPLKKQENLHFEVSS